MAELFSVLWILIWFIALASFFRSFLGGRRRGGASGSGDQGRVLVPGSSGSDPVPRATSSQNRGEYALQKRLAERKAAQAPQGSGSATVRLSGMGSAMMEDRQNDWLARQLREEAYIARHSKLDLGAAHERECAAEEVKIRRPGRK